mmetsp:Transcript_17490/g.26477  ORF Transcript_17490/g.26477 Transcript_17490/m.26477 type:complete len:690 (-) Transcript_17490:415-2484(-)
MTSLELESSDNEDEFEGVGTVYRGRLFRREVRRRRGFLQAALVIVTVFVGIAWLTVDSKEETRAKQMEVMKEKSVKNSSSYCSQLCPARLAQRKRRHGGDLRDIKDLSSNVQSAKVKLVEDLKKKYGSYYDTIMMENGKWRGGFQAVTPEISGPRFRRKLKMKILEMQVLLQAENSNVDGCDCNEEKGSKYKSRRQLEVENVVLPDLKQTYANFVWATGGHSAAAGHGNLYNESYTAMMERSVKPIFKSVGIAFDGRNYAMGGMRSAPEIALCQESIFGVDADIITWDFGMTDVPHSWKHFLYLSRAGTHRNRPAFIGINIHGFDFEEKLSVYKKAEAKGLTTFYLSGEVIKNMQDVVPDMFGMNQEEIDAIPEYVRYFKCQNEIEKSDPGCADNKYNEALCSNRRHKAPWHPGWKSNSLYGNLMAFFLIENLESTIEELIKEDFDPATKLRELKDEEQKDYEIFANDGKLENVAIPGFLEESIVPDVHPDMIHHAQTICHTALAPSKLRYEGILTETDLKGIIDYEQGISKVKADKGKSEGPMRLVFDEGQRNPPCPVLTKVDYKDFFYANEKDGWTSLSIPNDSEKQEYGPWTPRGLIMVCFLICDWGKCPDGDIREPALKDEKLKMKVNGVNVVELIQTAECSIMKHDDGYFFEADDNGRYEIEVLIVPSETETIQYTKITSVIVF